jgi:release factor glutamine methyltransferase
VLIPRPDTEVLVDTTLELLSEVPDGAIVLDYGTGSGSIAVTLAAERPSLKLLALDNSRDALDLARENSKAHDVVDRIGFVLSEGLSRMPERFTGKLSAIVANPPYIADEERALMAPDVLDYEPATALFPGDDPLLHYRLLATEGPRWLQDNGVLALEVGYKQAAPVCSLLEAAGWRELKVRSDLARIDRVVSARRP